MAIHLSQVVQIHRILQQRKKIAICNDLVRSSWKLPGKEGNLHNFQWENPVKTEKKLIVDRMQIKLVNNNAPIHKILNFTSHRTCNKLAQI